MTDNDLASRFLAWVKEQPAEREYNFWSWSCCAVSQFRRPGGRDWLHLHDLFGDDLRESSTFGALALRLEAAMDEVGT